MTSARLARRKVQTGQEQLAVLGPPPRQIIRHDERGNGAQPGDDRACLVEPPHMGVARGRNAIRLREAGVFMDREEDVWNCRLEAPT